MTIFISRDALLADLFPEAGDDLEGAIADYYAVGPVRPTVTVGADFVRIDVDVEQTEAYQADLDKAMGFAQRGKTGRAREILERLVQRYPAASDLHRMLAQTYVEAGDGEAAVDPLIDALRWDPENAYALVLMGNVQFRTFRDVDAARRYYDRAIALNPDDHLTLNNLGAVMMEQGKPDQAERYFRLAAEARPEYPNTHLGLALMYARTGDMQGAFSNAIAALRLADARDPVHASALQTARRAAAQFAQDTPAETLYRPYLLEVQEAAGKRVRVETDASLATQAKIEIAEYRGRAEHIVKVKPGAEATAHLVCHELAHLALIAEARASGQNRMFTTRPALRDQFVADHGRDVQAFVRRGMPRAEAESFVAGLADGLNSQAFNAPVDLFIEDRLYRDQPALRPVQFASLVSMLTQYAATSSSKEIRAMTPARVFDANVVYNLTHAFQLRDLYGVDLVGDFGADRRQLRDAERLYDEFLEVRGERRPGEEYAFVQDWAEDLAIAPYFELIPEVEGPLPGTRTPDEVMAQVESDPLGLNAPERSDSTNEMSLVGSPAASMAVTMYLLDALDLFDGRDQAFVQSVAFEVAMLGNYGLDADDPARKYTLQTVPGKKFSALHLLAYMYAGFKQIDPSLDAELRFDDEYAQAQALKTAR